MPDAALKPPVWLMDRLVAELRESGDEDTLEALLEGAGHG